LLPGGQRGKGDIIDNPQRKAVHRQRLFQVVKHRRDIVGQNIFTAQRIAATDNQRRIVVMIEGVFDIQAQRFRLRARLFGAVEDGNTLHAGGQLREKVGQRKRPKQMHAEQPDLLPAAFSVSTTSWMVSHTDPMAIITRSASGAP
jgi:hypothetical protein